MFLGTPRGHKGVDDLIDATEGHKLRVIGVPYDRAFFEDLRALATPALRHRVILNFEGLEYMNSGGIGLLVTLLVRANRQKQKLLAYGLTDHYRQIFSLTRLDEAISIHPDKESALSAV